MLLARHASGWGKRNGHSLNPNTPLILIEPCDTMMVILPLRFPNPSHSYQDAGRALLEERLGLLWDASAMGHYLALQHCSCLKLMGTLCSNLLVVLCLMPCLAAFLTCLHLQANAFSCSPWQSSAPVGKASLWDAGGPGKENQGLEGPDIPWNNPSLHPGTFPLVRGAFISPEQMKLFRRQWSGEVEALWAPRRLLHVRFWKALIVSIQLWSVLWRCWGAAKGSFFSSEGSEWVWWLWNTWDQQRGSAICWIWEVWTARVS